MSQQIVSWQQDGIDSGWFYADNIGSVRNGDSYRRGGWWFLPQWPPDMADHDVGPFKTRAAAIAETERLTLQR